MESEGSILSFPQYYRGTSNRNILLAIIIIIVVLLLLFCSAGSTRITNNDHGCAGRILSYHHESETTNNYHRNLSSFGTILITHGRIPNNGTRYDAIIGRGQYQERAHDEGHELEDDDDLPVKPRGGTTINAGTGDRADLLSGMGCDESERSEECRRPRTENYGGDDRFHHPARLHLGRHRHALPVSRLL